MAQPGGIISEPGKPASRRIRSRGIAARVGRKRNRPPNWVRERPRTQVESSDIGDLGGRRPRAGRSFVVGPARQASEALLLEDLGDGDRAERMPLVGQGAADVIDGEVLLPQGDDGVAEGIGLGRGLGPLGRRQEEGAAGILAELVDQDTEAARGIAEAAGDLGAGEAIDEEGAEGLVLAVGGVGGLEEDAGEVR